MTIVKVLMSTYNGERYLTDQIDSTLKQENVEVNLLVRDDGSTDRTLEILEQYAQQGKLAYIQGQNIYLDAQFLEIGHMAHDADYYAFADQDDIWFPDKLAIADSVLEEFGDKPAIYSAQLMVI